MNSDNKSEEQVQAEIDHDIFIIGGGINGCGIARDAAGRGYSVYLCEADDLASGTSSQSTKLIHGGLRYLEHYEFKLVREALTEREILWRVAPHIIHPLRFVLPYHKGLRPWWLLRIGLFMYDHLGGRKLLPASNAVSLIDTVEGDCLKPNFVKGLEYSDCWVNDSRLVILNAMDALEYGAVIKPQHKCVGIERHVNSWLVTVENQLTKKTETVTAKVLINAAGPWVDDIINIMKTDSETPAKNIRKVQGSHIVVPKLYDHDKCYIFQNEDDRITFAIPYHEDYTYLGTTDYEIDGDPRDAKITDEEVVYLCEAANDYFKTEITPDDVVSTYAGVRALYNDGSTDGEKKAQEATRDYILQIDEQSEGKAPLVNIFGGKITTYRRLAESMMEIVDDLLGKENNHWTEHAHLPGGDFRIEDKQKLHGLFKRDYGFLPRGVITRLLRNYGSKTALILGKADSEVDLGINFGHGLYQSEVEYLIENEFAIHVDDILLRRSKLGLRFNQEQKNALDAWLKEFFS
ncbi:MAG: glycerol-3-phosphate dehydrogenase [Cocleimonas sp.]